MLPVRPGRRPAAASPRTVRRLVPMDSEQELGEVAQMRTFDPTTGSVTVTLSAFPSRSTLIVQNYKKLVSDQQKIAEVGEYVARLPLSRRKELAIESAQRKSVSDFASMMRRDVFDQEVCLHRAQAALRMSIEHMLGDMNHDTRELSLIRVNSAAVDAVLFAEAERLADQTIKQHLTKVVPDSTTTVDILEMRLDAWRRNNVPQPPRVVLDPVQSRTRRASFRH